MASICKEYAVNWKDHMSHLKEAFESLLDSNEFVDVTLYCDGQRIGAHKMVLSACSPYFRKIFKDVPCQHHVIVLNNVDFSIVEQLVQFIYHGEVSVPNSKLNSFLQTARTLQISGLTGVRSLNETSNDEEVVEPSETGVNKRKPDGSELAAMQQASKLPRLDAAPAEVEDIKLIDVKHEPDEPDLFDSFEDPLQQDSSSHDYVKEATYLSEEEELESENMDDMGTSEEVLDETDAAASTAKDSSDSLLPSKSKHIYEEAYSAYSKWCHKQNIETTTEDSILTYFDSDLSRYKSSTLWTKYSMLRSTISLREGIDISKFSGIIPFLKRKGEGHTPKKSLTFTKRQIDDFLMRADNKEHLLNKVILIFGVAGGCRCQELVSLTTTSVEDSRTHFLVKIADAESKKDRTFIVLPGDRENLNLLKIVRAYMALRPAKTTHKRFFVSYLREKCTVQPVGIHRVGGVPNLVAKFLNLENPSLYTGHCFRRTSAALLANRQYNSYLQIG